MHHIQWASNTYRPSSLRKEIYSGFRSKPFHRKLQKRASSLPSSRRPSNGWEREHEAENKPQRDCPVRGVVKQIPDVFREVPFFGDLENDSDEEDRKNGVPIIFSEPRGCPLSPRLIEKVSQNLEEALEEKDSLIELLSITKRRYFKVFNWSSDAEGYHGDRATKQYALKLEDRYLQLIEEKHQLESEISHLRTMLMSFKNHITPSQTAGTKTGPGGSISWAASDGYERFQSGAIFPLEYEGTDYNFI
ncbi:hypothetical protein GGR53DRAFT_525705 [Hypoxylon sp. FL1150]|nr:hypothetical protein GGR53DRAFT_525705 [Hypoxylon sp. FL1150]